MNILYFNSKCSKSMKCIEILKNKNIEFKAIEYRKNPMNINELTNIIEHLIGPTKAILREDEKEYKKYLINNKLPLEKIDYVEILYKFPEFMQRPIFFNKRNYIICRPPEKVLNYINV